MRAALAALLLCAGCVTTTPRASLPVFGPGPATNLGGVSMTGPEWTNASAHVAWSLAVPLAGRACYGRQGLWTAGLSWMAYSVAQEAFFHAPEHPGPGYPAEVRTDLLTRLLPTAALLAWDIWSHR